MRVPSIFIVACVVAFASTLVESNSNPFAFQGCAVANAAAPGAAHPKSTSSDWPADWRLVHKEVHGQRDPRRDPIKCMEVPLRSHATPPRSFKMGSWNMEEARNFLTDHQSELVSVKNKPFIKTTAGHPAGHRSMLSATLSSARVDDRPTRSAPAKVQDIGSRQSDGAVSMNGPFVSELNTTLVPRLRGSNETECLGPSLGAVDESIVSLVKWCVPFYSPPSCAACTRGSYKEVVWFKCLEYFDIKRESIWFMLMLLLVNGHTCWNFNYKVTKVKLKNN